MELILYTFSKRKNSTKQPSGGTTYDVKLKQGCSTESPIFLIDGVNLNYNYAKWNNSFYFIDDIVLSLNNIYEIHCSIDVLATYKAAIGAYTTFIERSETSFDKMINDSLLQPTQGIIGFHDVTAGRPFPATSTGCYIIEVMNKDGIVLYACDSLEPFKIIFQPSTYTSTNVFEWIDSKIAQAFDLDVYIGTVKWIPFTASSLGTLTNTLKVGPIELTDAGFSIYEVNQSHTYSAGHTITLPQNLNYDDFRCCNPRYTEYMLYLPGVGQYQLDSAIMGTLIINGGSISIESDFDVVSGEVAYRIAASQAGSGTQTIIATLFGNLSVNVPIGKSVSDLSESVKTSVATVGSMAGAGAAAGGLYGALAGAAVGAINVVDNVMTPHVIMVGGSGNKANLLRHQQYRLTVTEYGSKDYPIYNAGRPCYQYKQISTIPGFIKCGAASLDSAAHGNEKDEINAFLNSGFYYE